MTFCQNSEVVIPSKARNLSWVFHFRFGVIPCASGEDTRRISTYNLVTTSTVAGSDLTRFLIVDY